jgi:hypothetical protein
VETAITASVELFPWIIAIVAELKPVRYVPIAVRKNRLRYRLAGAVRNSDIRDLDYH